MSITRSHGLMKIVGSIVLSCVAFVAFSAPAHANLSAMLSWDANSEPDLAGYKVYRGILNCAAQGPLQPLKDVGNVTSYLDSTIADGTAEACYRITAYDASGNESEQSVQVTKTFAPVLPPIPAPTWIRPAGEILPGPTVFEWTSVPNVSGYLVRIHEVGKPYDVCASQPPSDFVFCNLLSAPYQQTSVTVTLDPSKAYEAWIHSLSAAGAMGPSNGIAVTTSAPDTTPPAPPKGLTIASVSPDAIVITALKAECPRIITSTKGSTSTVLKRTVTCVK